MNIHLLSAFWSGVKKSCLLHMWSAPPNWNAPETQQEHIKNAPVLCFWCIFWVTWPTHHKHGKITNVFGSHYRRLFLLSAQRWKPYFWANYFRWPNIRCITTWKHLITPILCRGDIWGLIDPRSLLQEYLSLHISITSDVYIPCDGNKSDHKKKKFKVPASPCANTNAHVGRARIREWRLHHTCGVLPWTSEREQ